MATKVQIKSEKVTAAGGIFYVQSEFKASGVAEVIDCGLGSRTQDGKGYKWSEVISSLWSADLSGGDFLEDVNEAGKTLRLAPGARVPSADTVGRAVKELATDSIEYTSKAGNTYAFNPCERLNGLLLDVTMQLGLLRGGQTVDVDFDHVFTPCKKADAKYSYKKDTGYFPGVYSISGLIAGVENRDGNTPVTFHQGDTHLRLFARLRERNIGVDMFRADCGSYTEDIVRSIYLNCRRFYIRAANSREHYAQIQGIEDWEEAEINCEKCGVASVVFTSFMQCYGLRMVVQRTKAKEKESDTPDMFGGRYVYRCILTDDWEHTEKEIIELYNKRGGREKDFDVLNNDFMWKHLPCSYLKENAVFMVLMAMCKNFYTFLIAKLAALFFGLKPTSRLKSFVYHFITVPAKWTRKSRTWHLNFYTDRPYDKLQFL